jgi:hypothetical protein
MSIAQRRLGLTTIATVLAVCACAPATASAAAWLPQAGISDPIGPSDYAQEPSVATARVTGDVVAAWATQVGTEKQLVRASVRPAGGAWSPPKILSDETVDSSFPRIAMSPAGEAVAIWAAFVGSFGEVQVSTRPPGGEWSQRQTSSRSRVRAR